MTIIAQVTLEYTSIKLLTPNPLLAARADSFLTYITTLMSITCSSYIPGAHLDQCWHRINPLHHRLEISCWSFDILLHSLMCALHWVWRVGQLNEVCWFDLSIYHPNINIEHIHCLGTLIVTKRNPCCSIISISLTHIQRHTTHISWKSCDVWLIIHSIHTLTLIQYKPHLIYVNINYIDTKIHMEELAIASLSFWIREFDNCTNTILYRKTCQLHPK